jgi:hypothetical protein
MASCLMFHEKYVMPKSLDFRNIPDTMVHIICDILIVSLFA